MTDAEIRASIRNLGYPDDLLDAEINEGIAWALRRVKYEYPLMVMGSFTTVANQQVYDLFNPVRNAATQQGLFPEGLWVYEVVWNTANVTGDLNVFGLIPLLQGLSFYPSSIHRNTFYTPGDWVIWDSNWSAFMKRFAPMDFEHTESRYAAPLRIYPKPTCAQQVLVRFTRFRTTAELQQEDEDWFFRFVEVNVCRTLANKFSLSAGTKVGEVGDSGGTVKYWQQLAREKQEEAWLMLDKHRRVELHPASRSGQP